MIKRLEGWLAAKVGEEMVMMSVDSGVYIGLNDVGARIWDLIAAPRDIAGLCDVLSEEFEVTPEECRAQVEGFLDQLEKRGAISRDV